MSIDWNQRQAEWRELVAWASAEARHLPYDCIVAVSGGKDSTFIVATAVEAGLRVLGVSAEPTKMTPIGQANLENLQRYCDVVQFKKNREVYRRLGQIGYETVGDHEWPNHALIWAAVLREAVRQGVPLVLWGENPQAEYGSPSEAASANRSLDAAWVEEFGQRLGLRLGDLAQRYGFNLRELEPYRLPSAEQLAGIRSEFLGHYIAWDTVAQVETAKRYGFRPRPNGPPYGALWDFENVDCALIPFHDALALAKFGYTRAAAQASIAVRHGHLTRDEALRRVLEIGDFYPTLLESEFCDYLGITAEQSRRIFRSFVNPALFYAPGDGMELQRREPIR